MQDDEITALEALSQEARERGQMAMEHLTNAHSRILPTVLPIYGERANGVPYLHGSAFLLRIRDFVFLVTAAHVVDDDRGKPLWIGGAGESVVQVAGQFTYAKTAEMVDLAFSPLRGNAFSLLDRYKPINVSQLDVSDWPAPHRVYSFVGFPSSTNKPSLRDKTLSPTAQSFSSHQALSLDEYAGFGLNPYSTFAMHFDLQRAREVGTRRVITPRRPHGISGSAVWRIGSFEELARGVEAERVVGVAVEFRSRPSVLLGTRIGVLTETIRARYSILSADLPWHPRCRIKVYAVDAPRR